MRTNLRLAFITTLAAAVVWFGWPTGASMSKTTKSNSTEAGRQQNRRIEIPIHVSAALQEEAGHQGGRR
ncbi:MAG TPA: hypothetical protein VFQ05_04150 [Candidatus Eisenbacteria bacterium]|nr:hypothetical protein [Candidatus Eisenbacteria bacterium]